MLPGLYAIPHADLKINAVYTNTMPTGAYRGAGRPEAAYYIERVVDALADELGMDPVELRRKNFIPPDLFPYQTAAGPSYDSGEYDKPLTKRSSSPATRVARSRSSSGRASSSVSGSHLRRDLRLRAVR